MIATRLRRLTDLTNDFATRPGTKLLIGFARRNASDAPAYFRAPLRPLPTVSLTALFLS